MVKAVNYAIGDGVPPPKSKRVDLLQRISVSSHILMHVLSCLIRGRKPRSPLKDVSAETVKKALILLEYVESQKQIVIDFIDEIIATCVDGTRPQPTLENVNVAVLLFPGTVVTKPAFKQSAPRKVCGIANSESVNALESLEKENCGIILKVHSFKLSSKETIVLVKTKGLPEAVSYVDKNEYHKKYALPLHKAISESTKIQLMEKGLLACD